MEISAHQVDVPNEKEFSEQRKAWRADISKDLQIRTLAIELQSRADVHKYTYQFEWCGVPIIRLSDDIVLFQEMVFKFRPQAIIETGIARGGSLVLSASIMAMSDITPRVLGLDLQIFNHTREAIANSSFDRYITMHEGDSASTEAKDVVREFCSNLDQDSFVFLILDSDHTHDHVFNELETLVPLLPIGSFVFVADTLIEEMPKDQYSDRAWGVGNNPLTAIRSYLEKYDDLEPQLDWDRRALVSEFRNGILRKTK